MSDWTPRPQAPKAPEFMVTPERSLSNVMTALHNTKDVAGQLEAVRLFRAGGFKHNRLPNPLTGSEGVEFDFAAYPDEESALDAWMHIMYTPPLELMLPPEQRYKPPGESHDSESGT